MATSPHRKAAGDVLPPFDVAAEEAIIGAFLMDSMPEFAAKDEIARVIASLAPDDFFREQNQWTYSACVALFERGEAITYVTLANEIDLMGHLDAIGGIEALSEIASRHFTAHGVEAHARIVARCALYRRLIQAAGFITQVAYEASPDVDRVMQVSREALERALGAAPANITPIRGNLYDRPEYAETGI